MSDMKTTDDDSSTIVFVAGKNVKTEKSKGKDVKPKSKKTKNWSAEETNWLIEQVSKRRSVIESKATNRGFRELNMKNSAWLEIEKAYNNKINFTPRTIDSIRAKWDNLKSDCKKKSDAQKKHLNKTGAAPDSKLALSTQEERVMDIMNVVKSSLDNPFDGDGGCITISYSSAPSKSRSSSSGMKSGSDDGVGESIHDDVIKVRGDENDDDDGIDDPVDVDGKEDDVIEITPSSKQQPTKTASFVTPTPAKRRKTGHTLTREELDATQMEIWELQKQHMIEKHQAYMDTLDLLRTVIQEQGRAPDQAPDQAPDRTLGYLRNLQQIQDLDDIA